MPSPSQPKNTISNFPQRALNILINDFKKNQFSPSHLKDIMKYKAKLDVTDLISFVKHKNEYIRKAAIEVVLLHHDDKNILIDYLLDERFKSKTNVVAGLELFLIYSEELKDRIEDILPLLQDCSTLISEKCITVLRKIKREDLLLGLMFNSGDETLKRIKVFIEEKNQRDLKENG